MPQLYNTFRASAQNVPDKIALSCDDQHFSYSELLTLSERWAKFILSRCEGRPRVALLTETPIHTVSLVLAIARIEGVCIPSNPQMRAEQLATGWQASDVNMVIHEPAFSQRSEHCDTLGIDCFSTDVVDSVEPVRSTVPSEFSWSNEHDFLITLSSGSTGEPKPIVISQAVKVARARQSWELYDIDQDDVVLCASPFFHSLGQRLVFIALLCGARLVFMRQFSPKRWLDLVESEGASFVIAVSSHLYALKNQLLQQAEQLRSLRTIVTSSAPIDANFKQLLFERIGCDFHEIYGATEVAIATNLAPEYATVKYATVGTPCSGVALLILDDAGNEVPHNEIGEIAVKSPLAFEGYYRQAEMTAASFRDGYFLTGDLGVIDEDGFLSYVSRKKDVIISGGINIYPGDIEKVLMQHSGVNEVAVIGVEDELLGEVVVAICVSGSGGSIEMQLRKHANLHLAPFQCPLKYFFVESLPLTPTGKVSKLALREQYNPMNDDWTRSLRMMLYGE